MEQKYNKNYYYVSFEFGGELEQSFFEYQNLIDSKDLYTAEEGFALEDRAHITILYGLKENILTELKEFCKTISSFMIGIDTISSFRSSDTPYDVIKTDIIDESGTLKKLHNFCRQFDNDFSYDYHPHATIAYVDKGTMVEIEGEQDHRLAIIVEEINYKTQIVNQ